MANRVSSDTDKCKHAKRVLKKINKLNMKYKQDQVDLTKEGYIG